MTQSWTDAVHLLIRISHISDDGMSVGIQRKYSVGWRCASHAIFHHFSRFGRSSGHLSVVVNADDTRREIGVLVVVHDEVLRISRC